VLFSVRPAAAQPVTTPQGPAPKFVSTRIFNKTLLHGRSEARAPVTVACLRETVGQADFAFGA